MQTNFGQNYQIGPVLWFHVIFLQPGYQIFENIYLFHLDYCDSWLLDYCIFPFFGIVYLEILCDKHIFIVYISFGSRIERGTSIYG